MRFLLVMGAAAILAGCGGTSNEHEAALVENAIANAEATAENVTAEAKKDERAASAPNRDAWVGKWIGVEGLVLTIAKGDTPGSYRIDNTWSVDESDTGTFEGRANAQGILFRRGDADVQLIAGDGAATGLKWLDGKQDCLVVTEGEGYCRD